VVHVAQFNTLMYRSTWSRM